MNQLLDFLDRPRSTFSEIPDLLTGRDPLEMYVWAHKLSQIADTVMDATKQDAIIAAQLEIGDSGELYGDKISIRRQNTYTFNNPKLTRIIGEMDKVDKQLKSLKTSRKALETELIDKGEAVVADTSVSIVISKK